MPAVEGLQSPLKAQPFSGLHRGEVWPDRSIPERPQVNLSGATAEGDSATGCSGPAPGYSPGLGGIIAERGGWEQR